MSELTPAPQVLTGADAYMGQIWQMFNYGGWVGVVGYGLAVA